jgi:uncharacterized repeat protein (TIGR03803 family)
MRGRSSWLSPLNRPLTVVAMTTALLTVAVAGSSERILYSFAGGSDGEYADTELVRDSAGNLYGTTVQGGAGAGTVFQVTPAGVHSVLYNFTGGTDGGEPYKGVTLDSQGNLYGTTVVGGLYSGACIDTSCGVVYKLSHSGGSWTESVIYSFTGGNDGYGPGSPVVFDKYGNLYGMTPTGGAYSSGVIFQLKPAANGKWTFKVIHTFTGGADGASASAGRLLIDSAGNIFGVATTGGKYGDGTVFEITPLSSGGWKFSLLYAFKGQPDAGYPYGGLLADNQGNLYGTTYYDGANGLGSVYRLAYLNGVWHETVLYSFQAGSDGNGPVGTLVPDGAGGFYGTTTAGGAASCACGTVFKLTHSGANWTESILYNFSNSPDGATPYSGLVSDHAGNFYGATAAGGDSDGDGAIYKFTP